jgi:hypothetical protein
MKVKRTDLLDYNYRRTALGLTAEDYHALQAGEVVELNDETATTLLDKQLVTEEK